MRGAPAALLAGLLALPPTTARATDSPSQVALRLRYILDHGAQHCPSEQTFRDEVARKMGYDPFTPDARESVVITLTSGARGSTVTVAFNDVARARGWDDKTISIRDRDCVPLVAGAALYLTIQFLPFQSPPSTAAPPAPPPPALPEVEQRPAPAPVPPKIEPTPPRSVPLPRPLPAPPRRWGGHLAASGGIGLGVAPADVAGLIGVEGGGQRRLTREWVLSGSLGVLYSPHASARMPVEMSPTEVKVGTTLVTSVLAPCLHRHILFGSVFGCVGLQLGFLRADGVQIPSPASANTWWAAIDPRLGIEVPVPHAPRLALRLFGDLPVPLHRPKALVGVGPSMSSGQIAQVWRIPAVTGAVSLGLVLWIGPGPTSTVPKRSTDVRSASLEQGSPF